MQSWILAIVGMVLAGCATQAQREVTRMSDVVTSAAPAVEACEQRLEQSPPYQALKARLGSADGSAPLALKASRDKVTPDEVQQLFALHQDYTTPCRKLKLEAVAKIHPAIVALFAEFYSKDDALLVQLTNREISWGQYVTASDALAADTKGKFAVVAAGIRKNLNESHASELGRRQQAATALSNWAYQQQVLLQNQQLINAYNRPRMTNCQYVGAYLQCTTF